MRFPHIVLKKFVQPLRRFEIVQDLGVDILVHPLKGHDAAGVQVVTEKEVFVLIFAVDTANVREKDTIYRRREDVHSKRIGVIAVFPHLDVVLVLIESNHLHVRRIVSLRKIDDIPRADETRIDGLIRICERNLRSFASREQEGCERKEQRDVSQFHTDLSSSRPRRWTLVKRTSVP
ncbi:MAG: hypothetical protein IIA50_04610 [Bacteroidetes bacterium]|nr:hypothetical protein [Bacteroidota bacterium]